MQKCLRGVLALSVLLPSTPVFAQEKIDLYTINRIKSEAFQNSKVMETAFYLTDVYGPRLTGSPALKAAAQWAVKTMNSWGLTNPKLENWGSEFGRGWTCTRFSAMLKEPEFSPLIGFARPWSPGTNGPVSGQAMMAVITTPADFDKYRGKLKGKMVLMTEPRPSEMQTGPLAHRYSEAELEAEGTAPDPVSRAFSMPPAAAGQRGGRGAAPGGLDRQAMMKFRTDLNKFLVDEGVAVVVSAGTGTDGGTVFASAAGSQDPTQPLPPPSVAITNEHYNRISRLLDKNVPVTLEFDIAAKILDPEPPFNVVGEIPGTNPEKGIVMIGAHLDSWTGGTGATDNAAGSAVAMEVMRILKSLDLKMARTVRIGLWTGEEQGLFGSRAYVKAHFADPADMKLKPEHSKLSGYFNLDNGSGKIRGVYLQGNDMMRPVFEAWLAPFKDYGSTTISIRNTGGTDHLSYDAVGLPGFQFIQDPLEYMSRTHHSNMDLYDRLQAGDLMEASAVMASMVYNAATREEMLPRKPLPKPTPARGTGGAGEPQRPTAGN